MTIKESAARTTAKEKRPESAKADWPSGREALLEAGVRQFSKAGYDSTTMRDIAKLSGMLAGSIYYHFQSKEALFLAVHAHAIDRICDGVRAAIDPKAAPWTRLTQAAQGYLESMLKDYECASIIITEFPRQRSQELRESLVGHRRRFEQIFTDLIADIPMRRGMSRTYFRLGLLGMLAWSYTWYDPEGPDSPKTIARKMLALLGEEDPAPAR